MIWRDLLEIGGFLVLILGVALSPVPWLALVLAGVGMIAKANEPVRPRKEPTP